MSETISLDDQLVKACRDGDVGQVTEILSSSKQSISTLSSALLEACQNEHVAVAKLLLDRAGVSVNHANSDGQTCLYWACRNGIAEVTALLLERGADANLADTTQYGDTPLIVASEKGHLEIVRLLLDQGVSVNQTNAQQQTGLLWAAQNGHLEVCKLLLERGADTQLVDNTMWGSVPLTVACEKGQIEIVKLLLDSGVSINHTKHVGRSNWTVLGLPDRQYINV